MKKKVIKLSATRITAFLQCKLRYWYNYVDRLEKLSNPAFKLGLACHETLEAAGRLWQKKGLKKFSEKQIEDLLKQYNEESVKQGIESYEEHTLGKELCEYRLRNFALGEKIVGIEDTFGFGREGSKTITTKDGIELIGAIDKSIEIDPKTLLIVDYKTSRTVPDNNKLKTDVQLSMYNLVARILYPQYERIVLSLDMLRVGELVYTYRTDKELDEFEDYLKVIHAEMSALKKEDAKPSMNALCGWCDYSNVCDKYQTTCSQKEFSFLDISKLSSEDMLNEWEEVRASAKILGSREKALAGLLMEQMKVEEKSVKTSEKELVLRQSARTTFNARKLSKLIPYEDFAKLVTVSPKKLKDYATKNPRIGGELDNVSTTNYNSAFLATRKLKKPKRKSRRSK